MMSVLHAANILLRGGIIAYPTEGVFGLGCLPDDQQALRRLLDIKRRDANPGQLRGWIDLPAGQSLPEPDPDQPITWIVAPGAKASPMLRGEHASLAVRITSNPVAKALCLAAESPLVSTSANLSGKPTARNRFVLRRQFANVVDYVVPGDCGPASGPSEIRDFVSGTVLRPGSK